jgi:hypothetical protein
MADLNRLKLKTGIVTRTIKDLNSYIKEVNLIKDKIELMKQNNVDEHDINKRKECLAETVQMVPEGKARLEKAISELQAQIVFFYSIFFFFRLLRLTLKCSFLSKPFHRVTQLQ